VGGNQTEIAITGHPAAGGGGQSPVPARVKFKP